MIDTIILIFYLLTTLVVGFYYGRKTDTFEEFYISKREFSNGIMLATLYATIIGGGSTCGIVSNVYENGLIFIEYYVGLQTLTRVA